MRHYTEANWEKPKYIGKRQSMLEKVEVVGNSRSIAEKAEKGLRQLISSKVDSLRLMSTRFD